MKLIGQRRRLLDYVRKNDVERYRTIISRLGIEGSGAPQNGRLEPLAASRRSLPQRGGRPLGTRRRDAPDKTRASCLMPFPYRSDQRDRSHHVLRGRKLAQLADGAVLAASGTPSCWPPPRRPARVREGTDFFPLTVDIEERTYAAGKIPGSFFRRRARARTRPS